MRDKVYNRSHQISISKQITYHESSKTYTNVAHNLHSLCLIHAMKDMSLHDVYDFTPFFSLFKGDDNIRLEVENHCQTGNLPFRVSPFTNPGGM